MSSKPIDWGSMEQELAVDEDICPDCNGELDTGWECIDCGKDWEPLVRKDKPHE